VIALAIDTSTDRLSVAAAAGSRVVERVAVGARRHASLLVPLVREVLADLGVGIGHLTDIAVSDGPGSFTGLRVGAAWVKGICRGREVRVWTASTLLVRAVVADGAGVVIGLGSALRGECYAGAYRMSRREGPIETLLPPVVLANGQSLAADLVPDVIVSDFPLGLVAGFEWAARSRHIGPPDGLPTAAALLALVGRPGGAQVVADLPGWEPVYGRPAEAQARWEKVHGRALADSTGDPR
jgi:tRNA threonylcarbamoyl adenosine modification protein YeaZ